MFSSWKDRFMKKFNKKQIAIVGVLALVLVALVAIIFHTCKQGKANSENTAQAAQNSPADKVDESKDDKSSQDADAKESNDEVTEDAGDESDNEEEPLGEFKFVENESGDKYDEFLAGKGTICFSYYRKNVKETSDSWNDDKVDRFLPKQDVSLEKLVQTINKVFASSDEEYERDDKVEAVSYSFIDCGMDGSRELVLSVDCTKPPYHDFKLVIKDINSQLQVVYACFSKGERWEVEFNEYGVIRSYEIPGNADCMYSDSYDLMDGTGKIKPIYDIEAARKDGLGEAMPELEGIDEKYVTAEYTLSFERKEYQAFAFYNPDKDIYEDPDIPNLKEDIDKCFDCESISMDEFNKMKKERLKAVGVSEKEIDNETFKKLEYTQIYEGKAE